MGLSAIFVVTCGVKIPRVQAFLKRTDNSALVLFRILFGALMAWQSFYYLFDGWVFRNLSSPKFTFPHIGMEWLQPLPGNGMVWFFVLMGIASVFVAIGFRYRFSIVLMTLLWAGVYFMQKTVYNNHCYLVLLTGILMSLLPAADYASVDSLRPDKRKLSMLSWCGWVMMCQMTIVYFFASVAKIYPGWLDGSFTRIVYRRYADIPGLSFFADHWFHVAMAWSGLLFDLIVIPMLLFKKTRTWAVALSIVFHLFNFYTLHIGIFPFFALSFALFFFPAEVVRKNFFWKKPTYETGFNERLSALNKKLLYCFFLPYFLIQVILPIRHWFIKGDVLWTEEGHRLSWRMMLRHRTGSATFIVSDKKSGERIPFNLTSLLSPMQIKQMKTRPDMIWQTAQHIKTDFEKEGREVSLRILAKRRSTTARCFR